MGHIVRTEYRGDTELGTGTRGRDTEGPNKSGGRENDPWSVRGVDTIGHIVLVLLIKG